MRRRRLILLAAACAVLAGGTIWCVTREREPSYNGKRLSEWIVASQYVAPGPLVGQLSQEEVAVHEIGTNALPWLLKWMRYEEPAWRKTLYAGLLKLSPGLIPGWLAKPLQRRPDVLALRGFGMLGGYAAPAAPALTELMNDPSQSLLMRRRAMICLREILGSDGMIYLLGSEADLAVRADAVRVARTPGVDPSFWGF